MPVPSESSRLLADASLRFWQPSLPMREWVAGVWSRPELARRWAIDGYECVQHAGELVYIPSKLRHAVLNEEPTLAVAVATDSHV